MLEDTDLEVFTTLVSAALAIDVFGPYRKASIVLEMADGLFSSEIWRLSRSLRIGISAKELPDRVADIADHIWEDLREKRCVTFTEIDRWKEAIRWACASGQSDFSSGNVYARERQVGLAYKRLKAQGYNIDLGAYGLNLTEKGQKEIFGKLDALAGVIGGSEILLRICTYVHGRNKVHDGMWLLGDQVPSIYDSKLPSLPIGWLFALGAKKLANNSSARKPDIVWATMVQLATDMAACLDCERYNQFEGSEMHASQFWRSTTDSVMWREFFTLPQVPAVVIRDILNALLDEVVKADAKDTETFLRSFIHEALDLVGRSDPVRPGKLDKAIAQRVLPTLCKTALGAAGKVNQKLDGVFSAGNRTHESFVLFEFSKSQYIYFPSPILCAAICQQAFTHVWNTVAAKNASKIVGGTMERALEKACQNKTPILLAAKKYKRYEGKNLEIDVGSREEDRIVLIETKAKSLTSESRTVAGFSYISDYTKSYFAMTKQLMNHEKSIREKCNPLVSEVEDCKDLRPLKVAVSPLSYGQLSDKMFASSVVRGLFNASLNIVPDQETPETREIVDDFNNSLAEIKVLIINLAPKRDGLAEIFPYLLDFFWLDLGQALYVLKRGKSVSSAFRPLSSITFSSRDFWTEVASAERGGMTRQHWN